MHNNFTRYTCIEKECDKRGAVRKYKIEDDNGDIFEMNGKQIRELMKSGKVLFTNLKLVKGNKIVDCEDGDGNYILVTESFLSHHKQDIIDQFTGNNFRVEDIDNGSSYTVDFLGDKEYVINDAVYIIRFTLQISDDDTRKYKIRYVGKKEDGVDSESGEVLVDVRKGTYNTVEGEFITYLELENAIKEFKGLKKYSLDYDSELKDPTFSQCKDLIIKNLKHYLDDMEFIVRVGKKNDENKEILRYESKERIVRVKTEKYKIRVHLSYTNNDATGSIKLMLVSDRGLEYNTVIYPLTNGGIAKAFEQFMNNTGWIM